MIHVDDWFEAVNIFRFMLRALKGNLPLKACHMFSLETTIKNK